MAGGNSYNDLREKVARLEAILGLTDDDGNMVAVLTQIQNINDAMQAYRGTVDVQLTDLLGFRDTVGTLVEGLKKENEDLKAEVTILRLAVANMPRGGEEHAKIKVPEPKSFDGVRGAKELENFLWDLEHYFATAHVHTNDKLTIAVRYFRGDAILWWRTKNADDESANRPKVDTWEKLKDALREKFLPSNSSWVARDRLKRLKQVGSIREYVKEFTSLLLDIQNMSDEDKLHNFISGMQGWAQNELRR